MLEPGLVVALGAFFNINMVIFCIGDGSSDHHSLPENIAVDFVLNSMAWPVSLVAAEDISAALADYRSRESGSAMALVVCQEFDVAAKVVKEIDMYSDIVWLAPQDLIESSFEVTPLRLDSFLLGYYSNSENQTVLSENYCIQHAQLISSPFGTYSNETFNVIGDYVWERRRNFNGVQVINTVLPWSPMIMVDEETMETSGLFPELLKVIENYYNFRKVL